MYAKGGKIKKMLLSKDFIKEEPKDNGYYIVYFDTQEDKNKGIGTGIGYDKDANTYYHNSEGQSGSVWNHSRDDNSKGIGWYRFDEDEIIERIKMAKGGKMGIGGPVGQFKNKPWSQETKEISEVYGRKIS